MRLSRVIKCVCGWISIIVSGSQMLASTEVFLVSFESSHINFGVYVVGNVNHNQFSSFSHIFNTLSFRYIPCL